MESRHWTAPFVISILLSVFGFMGLTFLYCAFTMYISNLFLKLTFNFKSFYLEQRCARERSNAVGLHEYALYWTCVAFYHIWYCGLAASRPPYWSLGNVRRWRWCSGQSGINISK